MFGYSGDGGAATAAELGGPSDVAIDGLGNLYIADTSNHRIRRVDPSGTITTVAGTGTGGYSGDGGAATAANLFFPYSVAVDGAGNLYIADTYNQRIRRVDTTGDITTVAGVGTLGYSGDGSAATAAQLHYPHGVAIDELGNVYIADTYNNRIRRVDTSGMITTVAGVGTGGFGGDGSAAVAAQLNVPTSVVVDHLGNLDIADSQNFRIRRVDTTGVISTVAGTAIVFDQSGPDGNGDGGPAAVAPLSPIGLAIDKLDQIYTTDNLAAARIRRIDVAGIITTVAGVVDPPGVGLLFQARLADPEALVVAAPFQLVAGGTSGTAEAISATSLEVVAGRYPNAPGVVITNLARFRDMAFGNVGGVAFDGVASIYLTESLLTYLGNPNLGHEQVHVVTMTDPTDPDTWTIADLASGSAGYQDGPSATAELSQPTGLYRDPTSGIVYVADTGNNVIRAIDAAGANVSTFAGAAQTSGGFAGDGGPASSALFDQPHAITRCPNGDFFVADTYNHRVRRIAGDGTITTVLGDGAAASSGEGAPANTFAVDHPRGLVCDDLGNVFVSSTSTVRMLLADDAGIVDGTGSVHTILRRAAPHDVPGLGHAVSHGRGHRRCHARPHHRFVHRHADRAAARVHSMRCAALFSLAALAGCFTPATTTCADGTTCPTPKVCEPEGGGCVDYALVAACSEATEGTNCAAVPFGVCQRGACEQTTWQATATAVTTSAAPSSTGVAVDANGDVYVADDGGARVERVDAATGAVTSIAGDGTAGFSGDGGPAASAQLDSPSGVALDGAGNLYIGDTGNGRIRRVDAGTGVITTIAGTGAFDFGGDDGPATSASFRFVAPTGLASDGLGNLYVADTGNQVIRGIAGTTVTTIAGTPQTLGFFGDCYGGSASCTPATSAELYQPHAVTRCGNDDMFIADTGNDRVRRVTAGGDITTVLGDGTTVSFGEGAPANMFPVDAPEGLGCDEIGNLFVTSTTAVRMVLADDAGIVDGGNDNAVRTIYTASDTACLTGLVVVDATHVQVTDSCSGMLIDSSACGSSRDDV